MLPDVWSQHDLILYVENIEIFNGYLQGFQNKLRFLCTLLIYLCFDAAEEVWRLRPFRPSACLWLNIPTNLFGGFSSNSEWELFIKNFPSKHEFGESRSSDSCAIHRDANEFLAVLSTFIELFWWNSIYKISQKNPLNYEFHEYRCRERHLLFRSLMDLYPFFPRLLPEFVSKSMISAYNNVQ